MFYEVSSSLVLQNERRKDSEDVLEPNAVGFEPGTRCPTHGASQ